MLSVVLRNELTRGVAAASAGVALALLTSQASWSDLPPPRHWVAVAAVAALALARLKLLLFPLGVYLFLASIATFVSVADGSAWAAASWWPIIIAVVSLSRASPVFALALTVVVLFRDAVTIVVLNQLLGGAATSGSVQYFLGFVGVAAVPMWFSVALTTSRGWYARLARSAAALTVALAVWVVLASGSRAALLGLIVAVGASFVAPRLVRERRSIHWRRTVPAILVTLALVPGIDYLLVTGFGSGSTSLASSVAAEVAISVEEIAVEDRALGGIRLPLWRQAAEAMLSRPQGHGPGSYAHVNHAYQTEPLLWSGSPHSVWALAAVETGVPGLITLLAVVLGGLYVAARRGSPAMPALLGATAVMSLDVFASMPVQSLVWWAVIGAAWGPSGSATGRWRHVSVALTIAILAIGVYFSFRLASTCDAGCDPIVRYGGHPRLVGLPATVIGADPADPRWEEWRERYPLAFWLAYAHTEARASEDPTAVLDLLRAYPFQSADRYVEVADRFAGQTLAVDVASCGLVRFFDGRPIHRDWRSSVSELDAQKAALEARGGSLAAGEAACQRAGIPPVSIGMQ